MNARFRFPPPAPPARPHLLARLWRLRAPLRGRGAMLAIALVGAIAGAALAALLAQNGPSQTAFAGAAGGQYAVVARSAGAQTVVSAVGAGKDGDALEIATVAHLEGYAPRGAVSPDGRRVALITPDGGIAASPLASLIVLDLETGEQRRLARDLEPLQDALWTRDSRAVVVTRPALSAEGRLEVAVVEVDLAGRERVLERHEGALTVAPVGFDARGRLLAVRIDIRGSTLTRAGDGIRWLSSHLTRDWALSPDGAHLAFVEANTWQGLRYLPRVVAIEGGGGVWAAEAVGAQALGAAWAPAGARPSFGREPAAVAGGVRAQSASGFDVPLAYSRDGRALAVRHWSGWSFAEPGRPRLQIVSGWGRQSLDGFTGFFGWSAR